MLAAARARTSDEALRSGGWQTQRHAPGRPRRRPRSDGRSGHPTSWASAPPARERPGGTASSPRTPMSRAHPACRRRCTTSTTAGPTTSTTPPSPRTTRTSRVRPASAPVNGRRATCSMRGRRGSSGARPRTHGCSCSCATRWSDSGVVGRLPRTGSRSAPRPAQPPTPRSAAASTRTSSCACGGRSRGSRCSSSSTSAASRDPLAELRRTFAFLGLDPEAAGGIAVGVRVNASQGPKAALSAWHQDVLARRYAPENERLAALVPDLDLALWTQPA